MNSTRYKLPTVATLRKKTGGGNHLFEVVSTFAGGGGSSTGYRMAGGKVLAVSEFVLEAQNSYKANWPDTYIFPQDVKQLTAEMILEQTGKKVGELDLFDGSPPCSAFSTAGSREKGWGKTKSYSDTKQHKVEDLFFEYIRLVDGIQPKVFVAENVSGLTKGKAKGYLNEILRGLRECGYHVECKVLNAKWLGVPQSRTRTIFVGVRNDIFKPEMKGNLHPKPFQNLVTLEQAFEGLEMTEEDRRLTDIKRFKVYQLLLTLRKGEQHKKAFTLHKEHPNKPATCMTATHGKLGARISYHWENRGLTVSEVKRIMSVPDDYVLTGKYEHQVERLGRMVAPLMMKAIAENIFEVVLKDAST